MKKIKSTAVASFVQLPCAAGIKQEFAQLLDTLISLFCHSCETMPVLLKHHSAGIKFKETDGKDLINVTAVTFSLTSKLPSTVFQGSCDIKRDTREKESKTDRLTLINTLMESDSLIEK